MKVNAAAWVSKEDAKSQQLVTENERLANQLAQFGVYASKKFDAQGRSDGVWYLSDGRKLFDVYHKGGIVGDYANLKDNEVMAKLEKGEVVLDSNRKDNLYTLIDFTSIIAKKLSGVLGGYSYNTILDKAKLQLGESSNESLRKIASQSNHIEFGDVYITGTDKETINKHIEINRKFANDVLDQLHIKR